MSRRRIVAAAGLTAALVLPPACARPVVTADARADTAPAAVRAAPAPSPSPDHTASRAALAEVLTPWAAPGSGPRWYDDLTDLLPNVSFRTADGPQRISEVVVHGRVRDVVRGGAFDEDVRPPDGGGEAARVPWNSAAADWWSVHLHVDVVDTLGPGRDVGDSVVVGLTVGRGDLPRVRPALLGAHSVVLFLTDAEPLRYDRSLYRIVANSQVFTEVGGDGRLHLPGLDSAAERAMLARSATLDELRAAAAGPTELRPVPRR
jgi:hypothetical protein